MFERQSKSNCLLFASFAKYKNILYLFCKELMHPCKARRPFARVHQEGKAGGKSGVWLLQ
jgi:hypothetical protein